VCATFMARKCVLKYLALRRIFLPGFPAVCDTFLARKGVLKYLALRRTFLPGVFSSV
jgi:hypothetical protein